MKQATLDLLDAELKSAHASYMAMDDDDHWKIYRQELTISPRHWTKYAPGIAKHPLSWTDVKFTDLSQHLALISSPDPGVYLFFIQPPVLHHGMPRYPFYVGISGENGSHRPLKERLQDYLRLSQLKKRKNVHKNLQLYYDVTYVAYALLNAPFSDLESLEQALHGFLYPWACRRDFPVDIKGPQKAWGGT